MPSTRSDRGSARFARFHRHRWWVVTAVSLVAVVVLLALDVDAALSWAFAVAVTLLLWGPVIAAWARGLWKSGKAFREGLEGR